MKYSEEFEKKKILLIRNELCPFSDREIYTAELIEVWKCDGREERRMKWKVEWKSGNANAIDILHCAGALKRREELP